MTFNHNQQCPRVGWPPQRERPPLPDDLRDALLAYQSAAAAMEVAEVLGAWDQVKTAFRLWSKAAKASRALSVHKDAQRYAFMTGFDLGKVMRSRKEILEQAVAAFELGER